ncbi:hypothetical protein QWY22_12365 [Planococcus liqunii]|uniref:DNA-binding protein n=1 Tax=Planococcus liqunii TaxID=3058394 RepID=A0ABT8MLY6_9BACL|nr:MULTISPECIES: hypothetical protein [unclassified Planococcus (in: firmicutes)]MDN7225903.1 hypothetical protein [Planococcus sp. N064]WKA49694.1 hypothetical protein QWY22_12365 [Planococcus sp. N056]
MKKIQGIKNLLEYLETVGYPMTEERVQHFMAQRKIPHSQAYGDMIFFDSNHIDWWIAEQRKLKNEN